MAFVSENNTVPSSKDLDRGVVDISPLRRATLDKRTLQGRLPLIITVALVLLFAALRVWRATAASLDGDEIFGLLLARNNWHDLLRGVIVDATHPPLFYATLKVWCWVGGESLLWLRLLPVAVSVLCLIPFFSLCGTLDIRPPARDLALGIAAVHPVMIFQSQHVRMYCLLIFFSLWSFNCLESYANQPTLRRLALLTLVNLALVYTHYYSWMIVGLELAYVVHRVRRWSPMAIATVLVAVALSPWAWVAGRLLRARGLGQSIGWIAKPTMANLGWFFVDLTGCADLPGFRIVTAVAILAAFAILFFVYRKKYTEGVQWLAVVVFASPTIAFVVSQWLPQSVWGHRHLVYTTWPFIIVLATCLHALPRSTLIYVLVLTALWGTALIVSYKTDDRKLPWDQLTLDLVDHEHGEFNVVPIYSVDAYLPYPLWFYLDCLKYQRVGPFGPHLRAHTNLSVLAGKSGRFAIMGPSVNAEQRHHFWLGYSETDPAEVAEAQRILVRYGCREGNIIRAHDRFHSVALVSVECQ
jgi:hypothetical protein